MILRNIEYDIDFHESSALKPGEMIHALPNALKLSLFVGGVKYVWLFAGMESYRQHFFFGT